VKKLFLFFCACIIFALAGCGGNYGDAQPDGNASAVPESTSTAPTEAVVYDSTAAKAESKTVELDGVTYRNNFYGRLIPHEPVYSQPPVLEKGRNRYFRIYGEGYEFLYGESVYCRDDQWQELYDYYANPANFEYLCLIDKNDGEGLVAYPAPDMDPEMLDALCDFQKSNSYNSIGNKNTRQLPFSVWHEPELRFVKKSGNGLFNDGAAMFYIWEGKLVLLNYVSGDDYTAVTDVPDELSRYFVALVNSLPDESE